MYDMLGTSHLFFGHGREVIKNGNRHFVSSIFTTERLLKAADTASARAFRDATIQGLIDIFDDDIDIIEDSGESHKNIKK